MKALVLGSLLLTGCWAILDIQDLEPTSTASGVDGGPAPTNDATTGVGEGGNGGPTDSAPQKVDGGCFKVVKRGTTITDSGSSRKWSNPSNGLEADGAVATYQLNFLETSSRLEARGFGFTVPETALITGISVQFARNANHPLIKDGVVVLLAPAVVGSDHKRSGTWMGETAKEYGSASDLWDAAPTPAMVNAADFGVGVAAYFEVPSGVVAPPPTASVDEIAMTIHYCAQ